jgi:transcription elongation factor GreA
MERFPITKQGFERLEKELKQLKSVERPAIVAAIAHARDLGDLSENAEYQSAREKQSFIEGRIIELEDKVARAEVIDVSKLGGNKIKFGAIVNLIDEDTDKAYTYQIVSEYEASIEQGLLSLSSPIAKALIGKEKGDSVEVKTPNGIRSYEIVSIKYEE